MNQFPPQPIPGNSGGRCVRSLPMQCPSGSIVASLLCCTKGRQGKQSEDIGSVFPVELRSWALIQLAMSLCAAFLSGERKRESTGDKKRFLHEVDRLENPSEKKDPICHSHMAYCWTFLEANNLRPLSDWQTKY